MLSISFLDEKVVQKVCITFITYRIDDEDSISVHLVAAALLGELPFVVAGIDNFQYPHGFSFLLETSTHA